MKRFLIVGFGRMGITHLAHINGILAGNCRFDVFDPSVVFKAASLFRIRENIRFLRKIPNSGIYDGIVITSPPGAHSANFRDAKNLSSTFFIEKPLTLKDADLQSIANENKQVMCGYVLRYNPCILYLGKLIRGKPPVSVEISVKSNLGLQDGDDWRFDLQRGGGCINELGSHAINLGLALLPDTDGILESVVVDELSVPSFQLLAKGPIDLTVHGDWNEDVRKTTYAVKVAGKGYALISDLQSVSGEFEGRSIGWSPHKEVLNVGYYMRGADFALQAQDFVLGTFDADALSDAVLTDRILERALANA